MVRSNEQYNQLGIGDCGHVVHTWPQVHTGGKVRVICDDCTKAELDIPPEQATWIYLRREEIHPKPKRKTPAKKSAPKPRKLSPLQMILQAEGLFDG